MLPYFKRSETWEGDENPWRGGAGPVGTEFAKTTDPVSILAEAARAAGFPVTEDSMAGSRRPSGLGQYTIRGGYRSSAATAYLKPARKRANPDVATGALATRVLMQGTRATGVEYVKGIRETVRVNAEREVVGLAGGAFEYSAAAHAVGKAAARIFARPNHAGGRSAGRREPAGPPRGDHLLPAPERKRVPPRHALRPHGGQHDPRLLFGTDPAPVVPGGLHAFVKTRPVGVPDIEFMFRGAPADTHLWFPRIRPAYVDGYGIRPTLLHPDSRGEILLRSNDPRDPPRIVLQFLSLRATSRACAKASSARARSPIQQPMAPYRGPENWPGDAVKTDAEIDAWIPRDRDHGAPSLRHLRHGDDAGHRRRTSRGCAAWNACGWSTRRSCLIWFQRISMLAC